MAPSEPLHPEQEAPFLPADPPPLAAQGAAWLLLGLFAAATVAVPTVKVPETVTSPFVLVPARGVDPVRAPRGGVVSAVLVREGGPTRRGEPFATIRSPELGDRASELRTLQTQLRGASEGLENARARHESEALALGEQLKQKIGSRQDLDRRIRLKEGQLALTAELAERYQRLNEQGLASLSERTDVLIRHSQTHIELEQLWSERREADNEIARLRHEQEAKRSAFRELERGLSEKGEAARIRSEALAAETAAPSGELTVSGPCDGTVLRLGARAPGAVLREGDVIGEVGCAGERLQAELTVPQSGLARIKPGMGVRLLLDAFPYQRFGPRRGTVIWVSPGSVPVNGVPGFRVVAALEDSSVAVDGEQRPLLPGMAGTARITVSRRTLLSHILAPLRQLREALR